MAAHLFPNRGHYFEISLPCIWAISDLMPGKLGLSATCRILYGTLQFCTMMEMVLILLCNPSRMLQISLLHDAILFVIYMGFGRFIGLLTVHAQSAVFMSPDMHGACRFIQHNQQQSTEEGVPFLYLDQLRAQHHSMKQHYYPFWNIPSSTWYFMHKPCHMPSFLLDG